MEDKQITELFWARSEMAIPKIHEKYGEYCYSIAFNILNCEEDAKECVNESYKRIGTMIPPNKPSNLAIFIGKIVRNIALDRYEKSPLVLEELQECIPGNREGRNNADNIVLSEGLNRFLWSLSLDKRRMFIRRYWYVASIEEITKAYCISKNKVKKKLLCIRKELKEFFEKEDLSIKEERILAACSQIKDAFIEEASPQKDDLIHRQHKRRIRIALAGCALLVCVGILSAWRLGLFDKKWPKKIIYYNSIEIEKLTVPKWEELTISEQYNMVLYNTVEYESKVTKVGANQIGDLLGKEQLTSNHESLKEQKTTEASLYQIRGISSACAIALKFQGQSEYYAYINIRYKSKSLGQFIEDLNLKENISFGSVWYSYLNRRDKFSGVEFVDLKDSVIWEMLLEDTGAKAVTGMDFEKRDFVENMSISIDYPLLGYKNISLGITQDGYLTTNLLDSGSAFYIGEERANRFMDYVIDNCKGYSIKYVPVDDGIPEVLPE